jgi:hypothetical protein
LGGQALFKKRGGYAVDILQFSPKAIKKIVATANHQKADNFILNNLQI